MYKPELQHVAIKCHIAIMYCMRSYNAVEYHQILLNKLDSILCKRDYLQMMLRHSVIYLFSRGIPGIIGFLTVVVFTRLLTPESYGQYALVVTGAAFANAVLFHWLSASLLRFLPQYQDNQRELLSAIRGGFMLVSLLFAVAGGLSVIVLHLPAWQGLVLFGIPLTLAQAWYSINLEFMRCQLDPVRYGLISLLKSIIAFSLGVFLITLDYGVYGALTGLLLGFLFAGIWSSKGKWWSFQLQNIDRGLVGDLLKYGLPLTASFALTTIIASTDQFMLASIIDKTATGLYAAGQSLSQQGVGVLMAMVNLAAYPIVLRTLENSGHEAAREKLLNMVLLLVGVGSPVTIVFIFLSPEIATVLLGSDFQRSASEVMPWIASATLLSAVRAYYFDLPFYLGKKTHAQLIIMLVAALLNIVLNYLLIPDFGLLGAAYASLAAQGVAVVLSVIIGLGIFRLPTINVEIFKLLFSSLGLAVTLSMIPEGSPMARLLMAAVVGGAVYVSCILALDIGGARRLAIGAFRQRA